MTSQLAKAPLWQRGAAAIGALVALWWIVELVDVLDQQRLDDHGIRPLTASGLLGIVFAPVLHADWSHVVANTVPGLILGFLVTLAGIARFMAVTAIVWLVGGLGTWVFGDVGASGPTDHIGASGLIFGWLTFLLTRGLFSRNIGQIIVGVVVFIGYGGILWGVLPGRLGVSWQGHLFGALAGIVAGFLLSRRGTAASVPPPTASGLL